MTKYIYHSEKTKTTCNECKKNDGRVFYNIKDIPEIPIHPNCKCWIEVIEIEIETDTNAKCDCNERLEVVMNNANSIVQNANSLLQSIDSQSENMEIDFGNIASLLETLYFKKDVIQKEVGGHSKNCKNYVDVLYKEMTQSIINIELLNKKEEEISNALYTLRRNLVEFKNTAEINYIDIDEVKKYYFDPLNHTIRECKLNEKLKPISNKTKKLCEQINNYSMEFNEIKKRLNDVKNAINSAQGCLNAIEKLKKTPCACSFSNAKFSEPVIEESLINSKKEEKPAIIKAKEELQKDNSYFSDETRKKAREFIQGSEGFRADAYKDTAGIWTIGYGHTGYVDGKPITAGMKISKEKAEELYKKDFEYHIAPLKDIKTPLTENQKIALASLAYNMGPGVLDKNNDIRKKIGCW